MSGGGWIPGTLPVIGYNFTNGSTSKPPATTYSGGSLVTVGGNPPSPYTKGLRCLNVASSIGPGSSLANLALGDFTMEAWVYLSASDTDYLNILSAAFDNSYGITMRFGNSGFGNRLQFHIAGNYSTSFVWSTQFTKSSISGRWFHVAFVRQSQTCKVFVDGAQQAVASATNTNYSNTTFPGNYPLNGTPSVVFGAAGGTKDLYTAEFAIYTGAKYSGNFVPPHPLN